MAQELIMLLVCLVLVFGVLGYIFFSKVKRSADDFDEESPFLGSESTNSYHKGVVIYENLHNNEKKAQFKGEHRRHV